jgi:hypothetical protein
MTFPAADASIEVNRNKAKGRRAQCMPKLSIPARASHPIQAVAQFELRAIQHERLEIPLPAAQAPLNCPSASGRVSKPFERTDGSRLSSYAARCTELQGWVGFFRHRECA